MNLKTQKRIASNVLDVSAKRVVFSTEHLSDIKEAITRQDIQGLISQGVIRKVQEKGISRVRARKIQIQKKKGRKQGQGSRKGKKTARAPKKKVWMAKIRLQRLFLKKLLTSKKIPTTTYRSLYRKSKGGFFRSKRHIQLYIKEKGLIQ